MVAPGLFVTGTDTGVGKTAVAVAIIRDLVAAGHRVGVYKPAASGVVAGDPASDAALLHAAAGRPDLPQEAVCPQIFAAPIAPPDAARAEGRTVDEGLLRTGLERCRLGSDVVVVEGAGGLFSPLGDATSGADLAREFGLPLVIVDAARLGLIGRTLMAVRAARAEGLRVAAIVLSQVALPAGAADDPAGEARITAAGMAALAVRLPGIPIGLLAHASAAVAPGLDWWRLVSGPFAGDP